MILGIDLRCLPADGSEGAGVAHATREITRALLESIPGGWSVRLFVPRGALFSFRLPPTVYRVTLSGSKRRDLIKALRESPCDLLFVPSGAVALNLPVPAIPWVHDVDIYKNPEWFGESWFTRLRTMWMFKRGLRRAPVIFSVSEYTGKEIRKQKIENRIIKTGEGGDESLLTVTNVERQTIRTKLGLQNIPSPFILILGTVEPRKNIPFALSVLRHAMNEQRHTLVIAGRDGWKVDPINQAIEHAPKELNIIRLKTVSDDLRRELLLSAELVLVPSLSEGFGLVALEAIQAGIPVIASDRGALPEIVGDTAIALEDHDAWKLAIERLLVDDACRLDWIKRQREAVSTYSWKRSAEIVWNGLNRDFQD